MTDELNRLIDAASQPPTGGFDEVDRLVRRRQRRRTAGVAIGAVAVLAGGAVLAANGIDGDDPTTMAKDPVARASAPTNGPGASTFPDPAPVGGDRPPPLRIATADGVIEAQQGSYCWGGQCADYAVPQWSDLPQVGEISPLLAAFGLSGRLDVTTVPRDDERCRYYPALVEADGDDLTMAWTETGGPPVMDAPARAGFGTELAEVSVVRQLGGTIERDWRRDGLAVTIRLKASRLYRDQV